MSFNCCHFTLRNQQEYDASFFLPQEMFKRQISDLGPHAIVDPIAWIIFLPSIILSSIVNLHFYVHLCPCFGLVSSALSFKASVG